MNFDLSSEQKMLQPTALSQVSGPGLRPVAAGPDAPEARDRRALAGCHDARSIVQR
jgi:hypothetical protein